MVDFETITLSKTNCYLIKIEGGYLLIDCGNSHDKDEFLRAIKSLEIDFTDIKYLLLTHHHKDHCGLISFLVSNNSELSVIMSKKCAEYLESGKHFKHKDEKYSNFMLHLIVGIFSVFNKNLAKDFEPYCIRQDDIIINGSVDFVLPNKSIEGKVFPTPGHTEDSISIIINETAFVGDAARNILNFTGSPYEPILVYSNEACINSWNKIVDCGTSQVCPAHGQPFHINELKAILNK